MIDIGLVGGTNQERSLPFDAQRTINAYPVIAEQGKEPAALYGTPGLLLFATIGSGPIRGEFHSTNGRAFAVSGSQVWEVFADGTSTLRGSLSGSIGAVTIVENDTQLAICDGTLLYVLTYSSNAFSIVASAGLPASVGSIAFIDGYGAVNENNSGRFYISDIEDFTTWDALDFATAESSPDVLLRLITSNSQIWLLGERTSEIWTNTGNRAFPFERATNGKIEIGILSPFSALELDNSLFWVGRDKYGFGTVYRTQGYQPQRISTDVIERTIQAASNPKDIRAWAYQMDGHLFYVLTGGGLETSLCFDLVTGEWCERAYLNEFGNLEPHLAIAHMFAFDKHIVGDRRNGNLYELTFDALDDNGEEILFRRIYTHISDNDRRIRYNKLVIGVESGLGTQIGLGVDPQISLRLSKDGARTWSDSISKSMGKAGEFQKKVEFRRLGVAEQMTFQIDITAPVPRRLCGSWIA